MGGRGRARRVDGDRAHGRGPRRSGAHSGRNYADPSGAVRAGLGTDSDSWWLYYRERDGQSFRKIKGKRSAALSLTNLETLIPIASSNKGYAIAN